MSTGGLQFSAVKHVIKTVVDNGVCEDDSRVMARLNEATYACMTCEDEAGVPLIPVGCMMTVDVQAVDGFLLLPKQLENAISVEVLGDAKVNGSTDVRQGWYQVVNPFTYVDPTMAHDNPLVDHFLVPDPNDAKILRRKYFYPGLKPSNAVVRVTGTKRYQPITTGSDFLLVQNIRAIKLMILAIEKEENDVPELAERHRAEAVKSLRAEVKRHQLDPMNSVARKAGYDADLANYARGSYGHTRALLAHQLPSGLLMGKSEVSRLLDFSEMRLMERGLWKGTIEQFDAEITEGGRIAAPARVETILNFGVCGTPMPIRSIFFEYQENGPGFADCSCGGRLVDEGERYFESNGQTRRIYRILGTTETGQRIAFVAKLRWVKKQPDEQLTIKNVEALRLMAQSIMHERAERWKEAQVAQNEAVKVLDAELREYLAGQQITLPQQSGLGTADLGGVM